MLVKWRYIILYTYLNKVYSFVISYLFAIIIAKNMVFICIIIIRLPHGCLWEHFVWSFVKFGTGIEDSLWYLHTSFAPQAL